MRFPCWILPLLTLTPLALAQEAPPRPVRRIPFDDLFCLRGGEFHLDLCPERTGHTRDRLDERYSGPIGGLPLLDVREVNEALQEFFAKPDSALETTFDGRSLVVTSNGALPDGFEPTVDAIGTALRGEERLEVRIYSGEFGSDLPVILDRDEADRREKAWADSGSARLRRADATDLVDGLATAIHDVDEESCVHGWAMEIAQDAVIHGPIASVEATGLTASVRSARWTGATYLDLALRYAEPGGARRELSPAPQVTLATPVQPGPNDDPRHRAPDGSTRIQEEVPLRFELPETRFVSFAGSLLVPDGRVLWIPCRTTNHGGTETFLLDLRVDGPYRPPVLEIPGPKGASVVRAIVHQAGLVSRGVTHAEFDDSAFAASREAMEKWPAWWPSRVAAFGDLRELGWNLLETTPEPERTPDMRVVPFGPSHLLLQAPAAAQARMLAALQQRFDAVKSFDLHGLIHDGTNVVAEFRIPVLSGRAAQIWAGVAGPYLFDWSIDDAPGTSDGCPKTSWFLDGFALTAVVSTADDKVATVEVNGVVNLLSAGPTVVKLADPRTPLVEKVDARRLVIAERRDLAANDATTTFQLGGTPFTLELTVTKR